MQTARVDLLRCVAEKSCRTGTTKQFAAIRKVWVGEGWCERKERKGSGGQRARLESNGQTKRKEREERGRRVNKSEGAWDRDM
eukprot:6196606-Pleurochrysis_carterae.AAC.2